MSENELKKILLLDDSADYRNLIKLFIKKLLPEIDIVEHDPLTQGIPDENFNWGEYDVLLLDFDLTIPGVTGLDILQKNHKRPDFPATIMLTGAGTEEIALRALRFGIFEYQSKQKLTKDKLKELIIQAHEARKEVRANTEQRQEQTSAFSKEVFYDKLRKASEDPDSQRVLIVIQLDDVEQIETKIGIIGRDSLVNFIARKCFEMFKLGECNPNITKTGDNTIALQIDFPDSMQTLEKNMRGICKNLDKSVFRFADIQHEFRVSIGVLKLGNLISTTQQLIELTMEAAQRASVEKSNSFYIWKDNAEITTNESENDDAETIDDSAVALESTDEAEEARQNLKRKLQEISQRKARVEREVRSSQEEQQKLDEKLESDAAARAEMEARLKAVEEERARLEAETREKVEAEARARTEEKERARLEAEKRAEEEAQQRREAEIKADTEAKSKAELEARLKQLEEERAQREQEQQKEREAQQKREAELKAEAEEQARAELEARLKELEEERVRHEQEQQAEHEARQKREAELKAEAEQKAELEGKAKAELEAKLKELEEERAQREQEQQKEREALKQREVELKTEAEQKAKAELDAKLKELEEERAKREQEQQAEHEARQKREAELTAAIEAEIKAKAELEEEMKEARQAKERLEADLKAISEAKEKAEAEMKAMQEQKAQLEKDLQHAFSLSPTTNVLDASPPPATSTTAPPTQATANTEPAKRLVQPEAAADKHDEPEQDQSTIESSIRKMLTENRIIQTYQPVVLMGEESEENDEPGMEIYQTGLLCIDEEENSGINEWLQDIASLSLELQQSLQEFILRQVFARITEREMGNMPYKFIINISAVWFADIKLFDWLQKILNQTKPYNPGKAFILNIPLSLYLEHEKRASALISTLRKNHHFQIALSEFNDKKNIDKICKSAAIKYLNTDLEGLKSLTTQLAPTETKSTDSEEEQEKKNLLQHLKGTGLKLISSGINDATTLTEAITLGADYTVGDFVGEVQESLNESASVESFELT
ncbi:MAG: response regulator [Gammaproteobacteria bacterium]